MIDSKYAAGILRPAGSAAPRTEKPARLSSTELGEKLKPLKKRHRQRTSPWEGQGSR